MELGYYRVFNGFNVGIGVGIWSWDIFGLTCRDSECGVRCMWLVWVLAGGRCTGASLLLWGSSMGVHKIAHVCRGASGFDVVQPAEATNDLPIEDWLK